MRRHREAVKAHARRRKAHCRGRDMDTDDDLRWSQSALQALFPVCTRLRDYLSLYSRLSTKATGHEEFILISPL